MFEEAASLAEVDRWLRDLNHKELEGKSEAGIQLDVLLKILNDDLMPDQVMVDRVDSDGLWLKDRQGTRLGWSEMSDGYRSALALLADILRHLINTYGVDHLIQEGDDGKLQIARSGVVLIDEIDAHLHPAWQQQIGFWLTRHFPHIQFLVTTHSPLILQAAAPSGIFFLPGPGDDGSPRAASAEEYATIIASRPNTILLGPAFGLENVRSPRAVEQQAVYAGLNARKRAGATLSREEKERLGQAKLFVNPDEE
jgi:hypothetical protein